MGGGGGGGGGEKKNPSLPPPLPFIFHTRSQFRSLRVLFWKRLATQAKLSSSSVATAV